jgi:hypothetical protein
MRIDSEMEAAPAALLTGLQGGRPDNISMGNNYSLRMEYPDYLILSNSLFLHIGRSQKIQGH